MQKRILAYKGNKCQRCGYDRCPEALELHHRDPNNKEFQIRDGHIRSWERIKAELDQCDLLCANCHREAHYTLRGGETVSRTTVNRVAAGSNPAHAA
jgi:hypothetical protein